MGSRLDLHEELCNVLGSRNVYFQPPESKQLKYDCIIYSKNNVLSRYANNNNNYMSKDRYELTIIYKDPDCDIPKRITDFFKYCRQDRHFVVDNLYHETFTLYY